VKWLEQQVSKKRVKRDAAANMFNDPKWPILWYLVSNTASRNYDSMILRSMLSATATMGTQSSGCYTAESAIKLCSFFIFDYKPACCHHF